ncbi:MAG: hypothetical protein EZS28_031104 [Streblomastix strix]|uniref:Uncharacterized protein n=1 Tax=Streblomastix strix TaxID=222440 RepID=A0A5J4USI4_9EUKA|nr:MAG: hypothetical protein EZS28_031104 [Streblomastix strix]
MKQSINAAKVIQGKWKRHKLYEQLQQIFINQRYKRQGEKPFRLFSYLEAKLGAKEFNKRVKKLNDEYYGLHKDHFNEPNITKIQQLNKNRELEQKAFVIFTPQNLSAYYAALAQARKKFQEKNEQLKDKIDQVYELEKAEPFKVYISFGSIWQKKKQVYKHQQTLDEYNYLYTRPSADDSYKTLPNTVVRDNHTNDYFKQKAVDLLSDYQDTTHEDSAILKSDPFRKSKYNVVIQQFIVAADATDNGSNQAIKLFIPQIMFSTVSKSNVMQLSVSVNKSDQPVATNFYSNLLFDK